MIPLTELLFGVYPPRKKRNSNVLTSTVTYNLTHKITEFLKAISIILTSTQQYILNFGRLSK